MHSRVERSRVEVSESFESKCSLAESIRWRVFSGRLGCLLPHLHQPQDNLLDRLEVDAVLPELLGGDQVRGFGMELGELAEAGEIGLPGARGDGQKGEVIGERF